MESDITLISRFHLNPNIAKRYSKLDNFAKELMLTRFVEDFLNCGQLVPDILWEIELYIEDVAIAEELYENIILLNDIKDSLEQIYY